MCLSFWSRAAKNSVEHSSVSTSPPVERALRPWTNARLQLRPMALGDVAECAASHTAWAEDTSDSTTNGFHLGAVSALRKQRCHHSAQACPMESPQMIQVSAALIATLSAETGLIKGRLGQSLDRSQSRGAQDDTDELDRTWKRSGRAK